MDRPIRSLHIDTERTWRGGEQQALYLAAGLARRGHVVALAGQPESPFLMRAREAGLDTVAVRMRGDLDVFAAARLARVARGGGFDLLHAHTSHAHAIGALAARLANLPCVVSRRVDFAIGGSVLRRAKYRHGVARYVAISRAVRDVLIAGGVAPERIRVVPSGIDPARLSGADGAAARASFGVQPGAPLIGALCHFAWHKGLETLVDAAPRILERRPDARIVLVGRGELEGELRARAARVAPAGAVLFPGYRDDAPSCLAAFDVMAAPSVMEGLNTTILDALALARPVVASAVGGIPEIVEHEVTGLLVPPREPGALADAVLRLVDAPDVAARLGAAGRARVLSGFTHDTMCEGTLAVYRELRVSPAGGVRYSGAEGR